MILILTAAEDEHVDALEPYLLAAGAPYLRLDPGRFPAEMTISVHLDHGKITRTLTVDGCDHELDRVSAVWTRRPSRATAHQSLRDERVRRVVERESEQLTDDVWETLDVLQVPAPAGVIQRAKHKVRQLQVAAGLGFDVPATVVGNDPAGLLGLQRRAPMIMTKRVGLDPLGQTPDGRATAGRFAQPVRPRDLVHAADLRLCPVIVQEYVPKRLELRVTVIGDTVLAAAIHSQRSRRTRYDWRHYDHRTTPMEPFELPSAVAARCRAVVRALGLRYGAIDLVLTPNDRYVFLEINPNGQYLWVERETGLPITHAIATLLLSTLPHRAGAINTAVPA